MNSMEAGYDEVLHWEVPGPVEPGESSMAPETPWGEGIQLNDIYYIVTKQWVLY